MSFKKDNNKISAEGVNKLLENKWHKLKILSLGSRLITQNIIILVIMDLLF